MSTAMGNMSDAEAVATLTGLSIAQLDELGGFTEKPAFNASAAIKSAIWATRRARLESLQNLDYE